MTNNNSLRLLFHLAVSFLVLLAAHLFAGPHAYAAPGDFIRAWGAQQHFNVPGGIAVDAGGNVLVTDRDRVQVFDSAGVRILKWGASGSADGQFSHPGGIAVGAGKVYVADTGNFRVQIFDSRGAFLGKLEHPDWATKAPIAVAVDATGRLYVAEGGSDGAVKVFDDSGICQGQLGSVGTGDGQYRVPGGVAVDAGGNVYVVDTVGGKVQKYDPTGGFIDTAVTADNLGNGIAVGSTGNIYLAFGSTVFIYDSAGVQLGTRHYSDDADSDDGNHWWHPIALAVDGNENVYTVDYYNDGVRAFDALGALLPQWWSYGTGAGQLNHPRGLAVDAGGKVYETDGVCAEAGIRNNRVQIFSTEGVSLGKWTGSFCQTSGLSTDSSGNVHVVETYNHDATVACDPTSIVKVFDSAGNMVHEWGDPFNADPNHRLNDFLGVVIDKKGNFIVVNDQDHKLRVYDNAGTLLKTIGGAYYEPGGLGDPTAAAVDKDGNIYVTDASTNTVQKFDLDYKHLLGWGHSDSSEDLQAPKGVAVDPEGHVFVADTGNNRIEVFDSNGVFMRSWGGAGDDPGLFRAPEGIALDPKGNVVYVADSGNNRIQAFEGYIPPTYTISGTVRENSEMGPVLAGATVSIGEKSATTSESGSYNVTDLPAGTYTVVISKAGHLTRTVSDYVISGNKGAQDYYLTAVYTVSGTVRHGNGDGPALGGVEISIAGKSATTSQAGTFSITGIEGGSYTLTISKSGYVTKAISFPVNGDSTGVVYFLLPLYSVSGTVHHGSASGAPLAGATVAIAGKTATTTDAGTFTIPQVTAGSYDLVISKTGYVTRRIPAYLVDANKNETALYLVPMYTVSGSVHQGSATGPVLPGAVVSIAGKSATTGSDGRFSIRDIPAGTHTLTIYMSGEIARTRYVTKTVRSYVVASNKNEVFYLAPAFDFSGTVRRGSASGPGLAGASVAIAGKKGTTGSTGTFNVPGIPAGTYTVTVSKTGYDTRTIPGYVMTGTRRGQNFYLLPLYPVSGIVRQGSATGRPLAGATVTIAGRSVATGSTGAFSFTGIPAGTHTITVSKTGFGTKTVAGFLLNGARSGLNFFLPPLYSLSGTVRQGSTTGPPLPGAVVAIAGKRTTTTSTGAFSITGILAGTYTITVSKTGFGTKTVPGFLLNGAKSGRNFFLPPLYSLSGTVRQGSTTGPPLPGAVVAVAGKRTTTTSTGAFSITGIPAGTYTLTIVRTGFVTRQMAGTVVNSNRSGMVFYLKR